MKKINLHPDALRVESFTTAKEQAGLAHVPEAGDAAFVSQYCTSIKIACIPCTERGCA